jgi:uncharacterized membrane protein
MTVERVMEWWQRSKVLSVLLFLSVGANLFVAGWLLGGHSLHRRSPPPAMPIGLFGDQINTELSADGARIMREAFEGLRTRFAAHSQAIKSTRDRVTAVLKAEPFSAADYMAASREAQTERESDRAQADAEIANAIGRLSPDDRRRLADLRQHHRADGGLGFGR